MAFCSKRPFVEPNSITLSYFFKELIIAGNFLIYTFVYMSVCLSSSQECTLHKGKTLVCLVSGAGNSDE